MPNLIQQRRTATFKAAHAIIAGAAGRDLTDVERDQLVKHESEILSIDGHIAKAKADADLLSRLGSGVDSPIAGSRSVLDLRSAKARERIAADIITGKSGEPSVKSLVAGGAAHMDAPLINPEVLPAGRVQLGLLDHLPAVETGAAFSYLRQSTRTNRAAVVATGALKPTSVYELQRVEDRLRVVAHLSEPIDRFWLEDVPNLLAFIRDEMVYGLAVSLEAEVLGGDGTGEHMLGLSNVSGIQIQPFTTDRLTTTRAAQTATESVIGESEGVWVFSPTDWAAFELMTIGQAGFALGQNIPVDTATRRLWGQPVATSLAASAGVGWWITSGSVILATDGKLDFELGMVGDTFARNQMIGRFEGRFAVQVPRPVGAVKIALTT